MPTHFDADPDRPDLLPERWAYSRDGTRFVGRGKVRREVPFDELADLNAPGGVVVGIQSFLTGTDIRLTFHLRGTGQRMSSERRLRYRSYRPLEEGAETEEIEDPTGDQIDDSDWFCAVVMNKKDAINELRNGQSAERFVERAMGWHPYEVEEVREITISEAY